MFTVCQIYLSFLFRFFQTVIVHEAKNSLRYSARSEYPTLVIASVSEAISRGGRRDLSFPSRSVGTRYKVGWISEAHPPFKTTTIIRHGAKNSLRYSQRNEHPTLVIASVSEAIHEAEDEIAVSAPPPRNDSKFRRS